MTDKLSLQMSCNTIVVYINNFTELCCFKIMKIEFNVFQIGFKLSQTFSFFCLHEAITNFQYGSQCGFTNRLVSQFFEMNNKSNFVLSHFRKNAKSVKEFRHGKNVGFRSVVHWWQMKIEMIIFCCYEVFTKFSSIAII